MSSEWHFDDEQLALLVDGNSDGENALLREHLKTCQQCRTAYEDALRYQSMWQADPTVFRADDELLSLATSVANPTALQVSPRRRQVPEATPFWRSWAPVFGTAAVILVMAAAYLGVMPNGFDDPLQRAYSTLLPPVEEAVEQASLGGSIVIPGAETAAGETIPLFRAGFVTENETLTNALSGLTTMYHKHPQEPRFAHGLVSGYLAVGQIDNANLFVQDARRRFPSDTQLMVLEGLVAYRLNELDRAQRLLTTALRNDPGYGPALVNLGLVEYEMGQWDSARRMFEQVRTQFSGSPLEDRATTLISSTVDFRRPRPVIASLHPTLYFRTGERYVYPAHRGGSEHEHIPSSRLSG